MFTYSYDALVYYGEKIADSVRRVAKFGYDAIELVGEPRAYDQAEVRKLCADAGIAVSSICSIYTGEERNLSSKDPKMRAKALDYVKSVADLAAGTGAPVMIVAPSPVGKMAPTADEATEWAWGVEGIQAGADYAAKQGVKLCIEAWNRYESYFLNRLDQCTDLMKRVNRPNVGVMGDTFHMNIEDESIPDAFRAAGRGLIHVHFADSSRAAPGRGHIDFLPIMKALREIDYAGYITFELLPASADPFGTMKRGGGKEFFDQYTELAIRTIKALEKKL
jgi:sugar phosphate isomerase/epimerase